MLTRYLRRLTSPQSKQSNFLQHSRYFPLQTVKPLNFLEMGVTSQSGGGVFEHPPSICVT